MIATTPVRALVFDAYGTLFDPRAIGRRLEYHFTDKAELISSHWRIHQLQFTWLRTLMDRYQPFSALTRESLGMACAQVGVDLDEKTANDLMDAYLKLDIFPEVRVALDVLPEKLPLAVLSNADRDMLEGALRHAGIDQAFQQVLSADDVGCFKPRPEVYRQAVEAFGCRQGEIGFVSGNTWDIAGARSFGLHTYWVRRHSHAAAHAAYPPHHIVSGLEELVELV